MSFRFVFLALCLVAAVVPGLERSEYRPAEKLPAWPAVFENRALLPLPLSEREETFDAGFPGKTAKFTDGEREYILRWVRVGSRKLHSSADCFRGLGYTVRPAPALRDLAGRRWSCFTATSRERRLRFREQITDQSGRVWTDVSAWFWSTALRQTEGPWLAVTIVEKSEI